jgi:ABC-type methionine transport system permease subunit
MVSVIVILIGMVSIVQYFGDTLVRRLDHRK